MVLIIVQSASEDFMKRIYKITGISEEIARQSLESMGLSDQSVEAMINIWPQNPDGSYKPLNGTEAEEFYDSFATLIFTDSASEN